MNFGHRDEHIKTKGQNALKSRGTLQKQTLKQDKVVRSEVKNSNKNEDDDSKLGLVIKVEKPLLSGLFEPLEEDLQEDGSSEDINGPDEAYDPTLRNRRERWQMINGPAEAYDPNNIPFDQFMKMFDTPKRKKRSKRRRQSK